MANLVSVTKESRLILKIGGITCGIILIIYILVKGGGLIRDLFFPKPPPTPLQAFGLLSHVAFPKQDSPAPLAQYRKNTIDGQLPQLPDRANVYKLITPEPNLLALENAKNTLDSMDFIENQVKLSDILYRWTQSRTGIVIEYNIVTKNFSITSDYQTNPFLAAQSMLPSEEEVVSDIQNYLSSIRSNITNIDFEKTKVEYLEQQNGLLVAAQNLGSTRFARVTLMQKPIEEISVVYPNPSSPILSFIISYPDGHFQILEGDFYNHIISSEDKSDYPIKTADQALEELEKGNAYILNPLSLPVVDITNVELKYYLSKDSNDFLLPVIVFTGINFTAYVEAIPSTALKN